MSSGFFYAIGKDLAAPVRKTPAPAPASNSRPIRQPTVRRVLKLAGYAVCGLCRRRFSHLSEAQLCLMSCWESVLHSYPLIHRVTGYKPTTGIDTSQSVFRCRFCSRDYFKEEAGLACARRCLKLCHDNFTKAHNLPPSQVPEKVRRSFVSDEQKVKVNYVSRFNFKRKEPEAEVIEEPEVPIVDSGDPHSGGGYQLKTLDGPDKPKEERNKGFYPKPFLRQNAKYRCAYCLKDYFTKMEVEQCFDGHFDDQGREIDPDGAASPGDSPEDEDVDEID